MNTEIYSRLLNALQKEAKDRTSSDLIVIYTQIENVNFLKQFIGTNTPEFLEMCQYIKLEEHPKDYTLFKQGDLGDKYYIIVKGRVNISINIPQGKGKNQTFKVKDVGQIGAGMSFGELALLFNSIRNATISTLEESSFIVLTKDIFSNYMKFKTPPNAEEILKFFDEQEFFQAQKFALPQKIQIVSKCDTKTYVSNAALVLQGKPVESLNFIKKGLAKKLYLFKKVYRKVKFKIIPLTGEIDSRSCQDPTQEDIKNGYFKELFLEIDEIYEGNLLSEYELLNFKNSQCSVLAYTPTQVISIARSDLHILPEKMVEKFKSNSKPYPPDSKLRKVFLQGMYWKNFKVDILTNMNIETKNKKNIDNQRIMDRDQPYEIPHETYLRVDDDSFNKELLENDEDLEKQVFQPLEKLFTKEVKKPKIDPVIIMKDSKLNDSTFSPINHSKSSSQNLSSFMKSSPPKKKSNLYSQTTLKLKNYSKDDKIQQNGAFLDYYGQSSIKLGSKVSLPPLNQSEKNNGIQNRASITLSQEQFLGSQDSIPQIPLTEANKKDLIVKQILKSLDPRREQNQMSKNKRSSNIKVVEQINSIMPEMKKKNNKIILHRYLTPKINMKNMNHLNQDDIILTERAYKKS